MAAPSGSESQFGWKFASGLTSYGEDIYAPPITEFVRAKSVGEFTAKPIFADIENMDPYNQARKSVQTGAAVGLRISTQPDVDSVVKLLVHHCQNDPTITTPSGGTASRQWVIEPWETGDSAPASHVKSLVAEVYDGQLCTLSDGHRLQDLGLKIESGKLQTLDLTFMGCGESFASNAAEEATPDNYTGKPIIKGYWSDAAVTADTLKVKVTAGAAGGYDATVKWTIAAYAGSTTTQIVFDKWYEVLLDTGVRAGVSRFKKVQFMFPSTSPATTLVTNDEWSFTSSRTATTPTYTDLDPLHAAGLEFTIDGTVYYVRSADIRISKPKKTYHPAGTFFPLTVQENGDWSLTITIDRDREDQNFLRKLITADDFAVNVKMWGNPIEANIDEFWQIAVPHAQVKSAPRDIGSAQTLPEKVEIKAFRNGAALFTHTLVGTVTSLTDALPGGA